MFFARYTSKVTKLATNSALSKGMSNYLVDQIMGKENIDVLTRTIVVESHAEGSACTIVQVVQKYTLSW
jgi:thioredoxin reductase